MCSTVTLLATLCLPFYPLSSSKAQFLCFDSYEQAESTVAEVHLQDPSSPEHAYDKGEHTFAFSLVVPASSPVFEKCRWGKVVHTIDAVAEGVGRIASNVTASRPIYLVGNPAP